LETNAISYELEITIYFGAPRLIMAVMSLRNHDVA